ncbi:pentapeptide repeat-containing protein [Streptomyces sp. B1-3]|uniref:pentapeptide repeat-containing protein n=1 Tax=Streptomyces sp. B1-3 TaxID=3141453 RepID=UPI003D29B2CB
MLAAITVVGFGLKFQLWGYVSSRMSHYVGVDMAGLKPDEKAAAQGQLRLALIQSLVALGAMVALLYTARTYRLTRRGQVTDRFSKALERIGGDKEYVRIGGILALGQILHDARNQSGDAQTVLQNYIVGHTSEAGDEWAESEEPAERPTPEVQTAVDALGVATKYANYRLRLVNRCLVRLNFAELQLADADLSGSDLRKADLERANLWGASLDYVDFRLCDIRGALFVGASLRAARFQYARMEGASFAHAFLKHAVFTRGDSWATRDVSFRHAVLSGAKMAQFDFRDCDFRHADLSGANMSKALFQNCRFSKADLGGADLRGADLRGALGLTVNQLSGARTDEETQLPRGLSSVASTGSTSPAEATD